MNRNNNLLLYLYEEDESKYYSLKASNNKLNYKKPLGYKPTRMHKMAFNCDVQVLRGAKCHVEACKKHDLRVGPQIRLNESLWSQNPSGHHKVVSLGLQL